MISSPSIFISNPLPRIIQRLYNGRKIMVWEGKVNIGSIVGWVDNPRIELEKKRFIANYGDRNLTQDEILAIMKNDPTVKLKELRDDIIKNGLREPLTLSFSGKLLDGNRRFFALKYALSGMATTDPNRQDLECVHVYMLSEQATEDDEQNVLVEENFSASLKIEWPDYVKARRIVESYEVDGLSQDELAKKFSWSKTKVKETLRINEITSDFMMFATADVDPSDESGGGLGLSEQDAEDVVAKNYQFFNEAQKSFYEPLQSDIDFKVQFFRWIAESKIASFPEVRIAHKAWKHSEAKSVLMQSNPLAAKSAKAILDYNSRVVQSTDEAVGRISTFVEFLDNLTAVEIQNIPGETINKLQHGLDVVLKMAVAARH